MGAAWLALSQTDRPPLGGQQSLEELIRGQTSFKLLDDPLDQISQQFIDHGLTALIG